MAKREKEAKEREEEFAHLKKREKEFELQEDKAKTMGSLLEEIKSDLGCVICHNALALHMLNRCGHMVKFKY